MKKKTYKYKNGATLLYTHSNNCNATAMRVGFLVGHKDNKIGGEAHFLEHVLFTKTKNYSQEQLKELTSKYGIYNAGTGNTSLVLYIKKSNRLIEKTCELASEVLFNPGFTQVDVDYHKKIIIEEYNLRKPTIENSIDNLVDKNCKNPYFSVDIIAGNPQTIEKYTARQLKSFMKKHFVASKFIASVTSSLSFNKVKKLIDKYFIPYLPEKENTLAPFQVEFTPVNKLAFLKRKDDKNNNVTACINFFFNKGGDEIINDYNLRFIIKHLMKHPTNSIYYSLRDAGLVYSATIKSTYTTNKSYLEIKFTTNLKSFNECISTINKCLIKNLENSFETEIEEFKQSSKTALDEEESLPTLADICTSMLTRHISSSPDPLPLKKRLKFLKNLTCESATSLYKEIFNKENPVFIVIKSNKSRKDFPSYAKIRKELFKGL